MNWTMEERFINTVMDTEYMYIRAENNEVSILIDDLMEGYEDWYVELMLEFLEMNGSYISTDRYKLGNMTINLYWSSNDY